MYGIYLAIASLVLLFAHFSSAGGFGSLTSLDAGTGLGFVQLPVQRTAQHSNGAPKILHRINDKFSAVDLGSLAVVYTINISIAGQDTTVNLDTGSFELWVDPDCSKAAPYNPFLGNYSASPNDVLHSPEYCKSIGRYDPALSPTAKDLHKGDQLFYADNTTVELNYYTDNVHIGGLQISGQQFGVANITSSHVLGIMGLGPDIKYGYNSSSLRHNLILDSMAAQSLIESRAFSMSLRNSDDAAGSIIFGGLDQKKFQGSLQKLTLESPEMSAGTYGEDEKKTTYGYFVNVQSLSMTKPDHGSSTQYAQGGFSAVLDSGTSGILTPEGVSSQICDDADGIELDLITITLCSVSCDIKDKSGGLDVNFDNKSIHVGFEDLVLEIPDLVPGERFCVLSVADTTVATDPPTYIFGSPFLRAAYAVFDWDNQEVHLAQADDCGSQVVAIGTGPGAVPNGVGCEESAALPPAALPSVALPSVRRRIGPVMAVAIASIIALL